MTTPRRSASLAGTVVLMAVAVSCAGIPESELEPPLSIEGTSWVLESGIVDGRPLPMAPGHRITLNVDGPRVSGTSACNHYGAELARRGSAITVRPTEMTAMACEPAVMAVEDEYLRALPRVSEIAIVDGRLVLLRPGQVQLTFTQLAAPPLERITERTWILEHLIDSHGARAPRGEVATFELDDDGSLRGSTGSRTLTGTYIVRGDEIVTPELRADGPGPPPELAEQDSHIVSVIGDGFTARVNDGKLILTSAGNQRLIYREEGD